jgi:hypothetical protein
MRKMLVFAFMPFAFVGGALAQTSHQTYGDGFGNSMTFGSDGSSAQTYGDGFGNSMTFGQTPNGGSWSAQTYGDGPATRRPF